MCKVIKTKRAQASASLLARKKTRVSKETKSFAGSTLGYRKAYLNNTGNCSTKKKATKAKRKTTKKRK